MSELTKQYFDKQLGKLATKEALKKLATKEEVGKLATKEDIKDVKVALEEKIETEIGNLARMTENRFEEIKQELDVKKRVDNLDHRIFRIEQALNIVSK